MVSSRQATLDIDYARVQSDKGAKPRLAAHDAPARPTRGRPQSKPSAAKPPAREKSAPVTAPKTKASAGTGMGLWLLAIAVALVVGAYSLASPTDEVSPPAVEARGVDARPLVKSRRANLKSLSPHLRDVRFQNE